MVREYIDPFGPSQIVAKLVNSFPKVNHTRGGAQKLIPRGNLLATVVVQVSTLVYGQV